MSRKKLLRIIDEIRENAIDSAILVEGKRDEAALKSVGIPAYSIIKASYKDNNRIYNELMLYHKNKIILLYDNDRTGISKFSKLKGFLAGLGVQMLDYRKALKEAGITYIEEIDNRLNY